jgi:hypothetical protein
MTYSRLKLYVSLCIVLSHVGTFFGVLMLRAFVLPQANIFEIMGSMLPLFGVFFVVIIKDTLRGRENLAVGNIQSEQMVLLTFIIVGSYILAVGLTFMMVIQQTIQPTDLPKWLAIIESAFGTALGLIIDDLFGGKALDSSNERRAGKE